ncbi:MAG: putative toxin-antitoxin system toxin component, PIN family [Cytophagales bacterium]|nr:putative toxin-antitoxin system toxin component, PIN family [Cytophagales bacterium]
MKVVLDTNILLVSIPKKSKYRLIFDGVIDMRYDLVVSHEILLEYEEIIIQKTSQIVASNIVELLVKADNVEKREIFYKWNLIEADKEDNKFVDCAIAGGVDYLVSNDSHFDVLKNIHFPPVTLLKIDEFMKILKNLE